jgi:leucyl aminopeptidase (aminopeptidase T)
MNSCTIGVALGFLSLASLAPAQTAPDAKTTAQTLVDKCVSVKAGDKVLISGTPKNQALLEEIALTCRKAGAFPLVTTQSEQLERRMFDEVPDKYDSQTNELGLRMIDLFNVQISVDSAEVEGLMAGADPKRLAARAAASRPMMDAMMKSKVRSVSLGNGLFPTTVTAKQQGVTLDQLSEIFWSGVNADYSKLHNTGEEVKAKLAKGGEGRLTNPNGTDLTFKLSSPKVFVSDGVVSPEEAAQGGPAAAVWLPAGEVYASPVTGSAEGKVVIDKVHFQGKDIMGLTLTFKAGKLTEMTAKSGLEPLKAMYDASGEGKDNFAVVDVGINQSMRIPAGTTLNAWMPAGMVSVGLGDNTWAGGNVKSNFDFSGHIPGCTLTVGGKPVVVGGKLE